MAAITDKFTRVINGTTRPVATTLSAQKLSGATSATVVSTTGWDTGTAVHGIMYRTNAAGAKVDGSQIDWKGVISGTTISNFTVTAGTDDTYAVGTTVELAPTAAWGDDIATGLAVEHNLDGTHSAVTATSVSTGALTATGTLTIPNNSISAASLATNAITLGYSQNTALSQSGITTAADLTSLSVTVTVPAGGRRIEITAYCMLQSTAADDTADFYIMEGATILMKPQFLMRPANINNAAYATYSTVATAGAHTYKLAVGRAAGTGSITAVGTTTGPAFILVKVI